MSFKNSQKSVQSLPLLLLLDTLETLLSTVNMKNTKENNHKALYTYINIQHSSLLKNSQTSDYCIWISVLKACALWRLNVARLSFTVIIDERDLSVFFSWCCIYQVNFFPKSHVSYIILNHFDTEILICTLVTIY